MDWLNYHHLLYFHTAVKEGGISAAARALRLAQPTVTAQIKQLERALGNKLFRRTKGGVELTDFGQLTFRYAEEIFSMGRELSALARGRPSGAPVRLVVGIADVIPKLLAHRFIAPALSQNALRLVCRQDRLDRLLAELSTHTFDLVLADSPISPALPLKAFNHLLGECTVSVFAAPGLAKTLKGRFPGNLNDAPFLLSAEHTVLRRSLDHWFDRHGIRPRVVGEFDDSALLKTFGQVGVGAFAAPTVVERDICSQYGVERVGTITDLYERFYAITVERRSKHPGVQAICHTAEELLVR